jgi:branched-chain amino acid aminotransferase
MVKNYETLKGSIWFNGKLVRSENAKLHVLSHGLHFASVTFEGIRVYNKKAFKLEDHIQRLFNSSKLLQIKIPYSKKILINSCRKLIETLKLKDGYLRPIVWRGGQSMAPGVLNAKINVAVAGWKWPNYYSNSAKEKGIKLTISKWKRPPPECAPVKSKCSGLYQICTIAKNEAAKKNFDDALMLDLNGNICETTSSNIFFIKKNVVETPQADCFLNGITRKAVIKLCKNNRIKIKEKRITTKELKFYDSCFITGTAAEITPVYKINNHSFDTKNLTLKLIAKYFDGLIR